MICKTWLVLLSARLCPKLELLLWFWTVHLRKHVDKSDSSEIQISVGKYDLQEVGSLLSWTRESETQGLTSFWQIKGSFEEEEEKLPPRVLEGPEIIGRKISLDHMLIKAFHV